MITTGWHNTVFDFVRNEVKVCVMFGVTGGYSHTPRQPL